MSNAKKTKLEEKKVFPTAFVHKLDVKDQSCEVIGYKGNRKGTMIMKGWHANYADFDNGEGQTGCITAIGNNVIIEIKDVASGVDRRFSVDLRGVIGDCIAKTLKDLAKK